MSLSPSAGEVVALGDQPLIAGFALTGVRLCHAASAAEVRVAWRAVSDTAAVVILTSAAAEVLGEDRTAPQAPLTVVMPP